MSYHPTVFIYRWPKRYEEPLFECDGPCAEIWEPDIFLTITCNANWAEIKQELAEGEHAQDRPDLGSRIFRAKLVALKKIIREKKFFGAVAAMICVIEFQKRGLPHAHFLIILQPQSKIRQPQQFD